MCIFKYLLQGPTKLATHYPNVPMNILVGPCLVATVDDDTFSTLFPKFSVPLFLDVVICTA